MRAIRAANTGETRTMLFVITALIFSRRISAMNRTASGTVRKS
jgi:hypothetical protein